MRTTNTIIKLFAIVLITATGLSLESAGGAYPKKVGAREIIPVEGVSLRPAFSGKSLERSDALYFEHHLNSAIRDGDWKLVCKGKNGLAVKQFDWELYNVKADRGELQNVADKNPEKVEELLAKWEKWAVRAKVQPWPYKTK
jgi:arylsulfatase A-like enzyme